MTEGQFKAATPKRITMERTFDSPIEDVWELWTTKAGIESWWGPDGFSVTVRRLDLRPGGELLYAMSAAEPDKIEFMKKNGMPTTTECLIRFTEVEPLRRLAYVHLADFIPGVKPYDVATVVELERVPAGVRMVLSLDAMHADLWTERASMGWANELDRLGARLAERRGGKS